MIYVYTNVPKYSGDLGILVRWCAETWGGSDYLYSGRLSPNCWGYGRSGARRQWYFEFHQPQHATLFALRWAQYVEKITEPQ